MLRACVAGIYRDGPVSSISPFLASFSSFHLGHEYSLFNLLNPCCFLGEIEKLIFLGIYFILLQFCLRVTELLIYYFSPSLDSFFFFFFKIIRV